MDIVDFREFCLSLPLTEETTPFDETTLVMKVAGKMYAMGDITNFDSVSIKCNPETAIELRELYPEVTPGYHMNKQHWNTASVKGDLTDNQLKEWIVDSYNLVIAGMTKKMRESLGV